MSDKLTPSELAAVKAMYPVSDTVAKLSVGEGSVFGKLSDQNQAGLDGSAHKPKTPLAHSSDDYESNAARPIRKVQADHADDQRDYSGIQKQQAAADQNPQRQVAGSAFADHETGLPEEDGSDHGIFRLTITIRIPNKLRRDLDGMLSTICDCLRNARGRCLDAHTGDSHSGRTVRARRGRGNHHHPKIVEEKVPF